jgi:pilus assembly protein FimV
MICLAPLQQKKMTVRLTPDPLVFRLRLTPLLLGLFVGPAAALTLGEVRVLSHLGEPLHATLPVRLDADEVLEARCLKLVPDRDGLGSASLVLNARLALREQVGEVVISSRQGVTDPILRFNLQVQCGHGFHSREYTLLLDPPQLAPAVAGSAKGGGDSGAAAAISATPLPEQPRRQRPAAPPRAQTPKAAPEPARLQDSQPRLRLSNADDSRPVAGSARAGTGTGGFQLRLSADLDVSRLGKKLSVNESRELKNKLQLIQSDDEMAEILRLRNQIQTLETQMLALRQKTIEVMGLDTASVPAAPAPLAPPEPAALPGSETMPQAGPDPVMAAPAQARLPPDGRGPAMSRPVGNSQLGSWTDYLIWGLVAAVTLGFGYMLWLYRGQHADASGLPNLFDEHGNDTAARNQPISRRLVNRSAADAEPNSPDNAEIVVPEKDRWAIEEAQILIAQGWREQAISLLVEQIESNPYQLDIWLMLFEIHQKAGNREAFAVLAERFRSIAKGLPVWNTIRQMGAAMDPDNPLYAL